MTALVSRPLALVLRHSVLAVSAVSAVLLAGVAHAQTGDDPAYDTYRRVVLGEPQARAPQAPDRIEERVQPGPYAQYLKYLGADESAAIAQARAVGEYPTRSLVRVTQRPQSAQERYERYLGLAVAPDRTEETLSVAAERAPVAVR